MGYAPCTLRQWIKAVEHLQLARSLPERLEFSLVERRPLRDKAHRTRRQCARQHRQTVDGDSSLEFCVLCVKMRRGVIRELHLDHDAVEAADLRHPRERI